MANAHSSALAELQASASGHEGRLTTLERTWAQGETAQASRSEEIETRLINVDATATAKLSTLQQQLNEAQVAVQRSQASELKAHEDIERLSKLVDALSEGSGVKQQHLAEEQVLYPRPSTCPCSRISLSIPIRDFSRCIR